MSKSNWFRRAVATATVVVALGGVTVATTAPADAATKSGHSVSHNANGV